jgi:hypothetical protein
LPKYTVVDDPEKRCTAHSKSSKGQCKRARVPGLNVCYYHGGATQASKAKSIRVVSEAKARERANKYLERNGIETIVAVDDPIDRLAFAAGEARAMMDYFASRIQELRYQTHTGEQLRAEVALHERWYDRYTKLLETQVRLGISERRVRIEEAQVLMMAAAIRNILKRLDLTPEQKVRATQVVPEELRAIEAPKP